MINPNKKIKIASILYFVSALLIIPLTPSLGGIELILGAILLAYSLLISEELKKNKVSLIIITVLSFALNIPAAILIIIALDELSTIKIEKGNAPPSQENKRFDLLLKLGLTMVLISGIIFATTTWEFISNIIKVIALIGMGGVFLGLSKFSEKVLKIPSTTKAYFILGISFLLLTWIGIGYFAIISPWFSYTGDGKNLVYFITFVLLASVLYLIGNKFKEKEYVYLGHMSIYLSIYNILALLGLNMLEITGILSAIAFIINIIPTEKDHSKIKDINITFSYLFWTVILTQNHAANKIVVLVISLINIINIAFLAFTNKSKLNQILSILISYLLLVIATIKLDISYDNVFILFLVNSVYALIIKYQRINQNNSIIVTSQITNAITNSFLLLIIGENSLTRALLAAAILLVINSVNSLNLYKTNDQVAYRFQPFAIAFLYIALVTFIQKKLFYIGDIALLSLSLLVVTFTAIYHFTKKPETKKYYFIMQLICVTLMVSYNVDSLELLPAITTTLSLIYLFFTRRKEEQVRLLFYIGILLSVVLTTFVIIDYGCSSIIAHLINLAIFISLAFTVKDKILKKVNYLSVVVPLFYLVYTIDMANNLKLVITNLFWLYIIFLFLKLFIKNSKIKDIVGTIGLSLATSSIIFQADILVGIYIGLLSILVIFLTFNEDNYKKLFVCGIVITIVNIVAQLWELWKVIPFYLYLLLVGITIIVFVTLKEIKKKNEQEKRLVESHSGNVEQKNINISKESMIQSNIQHKEKFKIVEEINNSKQEADGIDTQKTFKFCPICGTENHNGKFCKSCGKKLQK